MTSVHFLSPKLLHPTVQCTVWIPVRGTLRSSADLIPNPPNKKVIYFLPLQHFPQSYTIFRSDCVTRVFPPNFLYLKMASIWRRICKVIIKKSMDSVLTKIAQKSRKKIDYLCAIRKCFKDYSLSFYIATN